MPIQASPETLLVQIMCNQTNASAQYEQPIQDAHAEVVFSLLRTEGAAVAHQINEADSDTSIDVEDEVVLLAGGDRFDGDGVVKHLAAGETLLDEFFDKLDTEIGVVTRFDLVADTRNCDN